MNLQGIMQNYNNRHNLLQKRLLCVEISRFLQKSGQKYTKGSKMKP